MMDRQRRSLLVARVSSGAVRLSAAGRDWLLASPGPRWAYLAEELYQECLREALLEGLYGPEELLDLLTAEGLWDAERAARLGALPGLVEDAKVELYRSHFRAERQRAIRTEIERLRAEHDRLWSDRHALDHLGAEGHASAWRARLLLAASLRLPDGSPAHPDPAACLDGASEHLDEVAREAAACRVTEAEFRELARTDPWRAVWSARKSDGLFGGPSSGMTEEQLSLVSWSGVYDSVGAHPDCPPDHVVEDDDMLDGWMVEQRRKRERLLLKAGAEELAGKASGAQEVYLMADTGEDAKRVMGLNDESAALTQKQRFKKLRQDGRVDELDMPDTRRRVREEQQRKFRDSVMGNKK